MTSMTKYLYRKVMMAVTLATAILVLSSALGAQYRAPQAERKTPRAVGVLETFKNGSRRLVPVTFFYEKHFYDATFYHATPVPFTLYSETVYEVQKLGKPLGTFTVQSATQNAAMWFGNGRFKNLPDPTLLAKKASVAPVVLEDSSRPVLHRREGSEGDNPSAHPVPAAATPGEDDPDRPKLHRRETPSADATAPSESAPTASAPAGSAPTGTSAQAPAATKPPENEPAESSGQDPDRPKLQRKNDSTTGKAAGTAPTKTTSPTTASPTTSTTTAGTPSASPTAAVAPPASAAQAELTPSDDPDHPILRRGKPVLAQGGHDLPDFKKEEPVSRQVAISDAGASEEQPLVYVCPENERQQIETSARALAQAELRRLASQRGLALTVAPNIPATKLSAASKKGVKAPALPELKLEDEQFVPYDLDYSNYATVVFSARYTPESELHAMAPDGGTQVASGKAKSWVVTVVARQNEGKLIKLYSSVSDPRELDLYPEVRLVDALDPEGYGRTALLFREQKRDGVSWLLGRVTSYELQPILETPSR